MKFSIVSLLLIFGFELSAQSVDSTKLSAFSLNSFPPNAGVYSSGGEWLGKTPVTQNLLPGQFPVTIKKTGFEDRILEQNSERSIIELKPISTQDYSYKLDKNLWFRSDDDQKIWLAVSGIVLSGIVAAHYKIEASNQFRLYNQTKEDRYLANTEKYDAVSGVAFGGMQISFGYLIYVLIWE